LKREVEVVATHEFIILFIHFVVAIGERIYDKLTGSVLLLNLESLWVFGLLELLEYLEFVVENGLSDFQIEGVSTQHVRWKSMLLSRLNFHPVAFTNIEVNMLDIRVRKHETIELLVNKNKSMLIEN
jgi:hypothetical protein